jgi:ABC-type polysaccharide/polyol phosphate transport system ATPase subunit
MTPQVSVQVSNVSMKYRIASEKVQSMKHYLIKRLRKQITYEDFYALKNISFEVYKGEVFGVIGLNGAGKSTLFKVIAGILKPTEGQVRRYGTIAPLIELGAGFNGELSGWENIYLNGLILGYSKKFIREKIDEIVEFAELGKFIHVPLKNYSSGMRARLGFAIATVVEPDLLIVDEVLSVGDIKFKEKSERKIMSMIERGTTVLFVSHSLGQIENLCNRVLWLEKGQIREIGETKQIVARYKQAN